MKEFIFDIFALSISLTPVIAALLLLAPLFDKRYIANFRYWLWLAVSIRLMIPLTVGASAPVHVNLPAGTAENLLTQAVTPGSGLSGVQMGIFSPDLIDIMLLVYMAGALVFLLGNLKSFVVLHKMISKRSIPPADDRIYRMVKEINRQKQLHIRTKSLRVFICRDISGPMAAGLFRPVLLLPQENYNDKQLRMVLNHELVHIKRHDLVYKMLLFMVCSLHWFNPLVHMMARRANRDIEMTCDHIALQGTEIDEKKLYSLMMIEAASDYGSTFSAVSTGFKSGKESLEARIRNIFDYQPKGHGACLLVLILLTLLAGGSFLSINHLPAQAAAMIPPQLYRQDAGTPHDESIFNNNKIAETGDGENGSLSMAPDDHSEETAPETNTASSPPITQPETFSQPAEVVVIDLLQMESAAMNDVSGETVTTDQI